MSQSNQYNKNFDLIRESKAEADRLDVLNARLRDYFGGKIITLAPVDLSKIKSVLEVGAGSGAWTLDAATALPNEKIVACDIAPLPDAVTLPPDARFDIADVTEPLPYEPNSFDLIHIRLLLIHVKGVPEVLTRVVALLKPGGWIVIEEPDDLDKDANGEVQGLAKDVSAIAQTGEEFAQRGLSLDVGRYIEGMLRSMPGLGNVEAMKLDMPFTNAGTGDDRKLLAVGQVYKNGLLTLIEHGVSAGHFTQEQYDEAKTVIEDESKRPYGRLYVTWGQKVLL